MPFRGRESLAGVGREWTQPPLRQFLRLSRMVRRGDRSVCVQSSRCMYRTRLFRGSYFQSSGVSTLAARSRRNPLGTIYATLCGALATYRILRSNPKAMHATPSAPAGRTLDWAREAALYGYLHFPI